MPVSPSTLPPTDPDGDGRGDFADVVLSFNAVDGIADTEPIGAFDCNGKGRIDVDEVVWLFDGL